MTNVAVFNEEIANRNYDAVMENVLTDNTLFAAASFEDVYEVCNKYISVSKGVFEKCLAYGKAMLEDGGSSKRELTELELDMVVGGGLWSWISDKVSKAAHAVGNFFKDRWNNGGVFGKIAVIGIGVAAAVAIAAGVAEIVGGTASSVAAEGAVEFGGEVLPGMTENMAMLLRNIEP